MITGWDNAYSNAGHIEDAKAYPPLWANRAETFRADIASRLQLDVSYAGKPGTLSR